MSIDSSTTAARGRSRVVALVVSILLAVSVLTAGYFGTSWALAANDDSVSYATERDEALRVGSQAVINFNTLDYKELEHGLDLWEKSSTGVLHEEVVRGRKSNAEEIKKAKSTTEASILDAALTTLDQKAGKATMIVVVKIVVTPEGKKSVEKRNRYEAQLKREGQQWKLSGLGAVPVG